MILDATKNLLAVAACVGLIQVATGEDIPYADPTIFVEDGTYYLTGTSEPDGFKILKSDDLVNWRPVDNGNDGNILRRGDGAYGENSFWAPQIYKEKGKYYLTYSAEGKMCVAESDNIAGPYRQKNVRPVDDCEEMNIDTFLFRDDDGKYYMYHARYMMQGDMGGNTIQVAGYDMDTDRLLPGTLTLCGKVSEPWELTDDGRKFNNRTLEGPTVIKLDGKYYLFYSANDYQSIDYGVGYAVADSPYGPWEKYKGNPIIHRSLVGENGSGHGDFFIGKDGKPYYVYHVHASDSGIHPRKIRIVPLVMTKNAATGIYDIKADTDHIIYPDLIGGSHKRNEIKRRDPFVTVVPEENCYYLIVPEWKMGRGGLYAYKSNDLDTWTDVGFCYNAPSRFLGTNDWWAPDTYEYNGKYYCFVTVSNPDKGILRGTTILKADKITGPYAPVLPDDKMAMTPEGVQCLDASLYVDENQVPWMVYAVEWCGPNVKDKVGEVWAQRLNSDLSGTIGDPEYLFKADDAPWVKRYSGGCITDAPFVMRDPESGGLIMTWSSFDPDYAIGQAVSKSGNILGPWEHVAVPLYSGGGHAMVFKDLEGNLKISFHAPNDADATMTIKDVIVRDGKLEIKAPAKIYCQGTLTDGSAGKYSILYPLKHVGNGVYEGVVKLKDTTVPSGIGGNCAELFFRDNNTVNATYWFPAEGSDQWLSTKSTQRVVAGRADSPHGTFLLNGGSYKVTLDLKNNTLDIVAEGDVCYMPEIWGYGTLDVTPLGKQFEWNETSPKAVFTHQGDGVYTGQIRMRRLGDGPGCLALKAAYPTAGDGGFLTGPVSGENLWTGEETRLLRSSSYNAWRLEAGLYDVAVDIDRQTVMFEEIPETPEKIYVAGTFRAPRQGESSATIMKRSLEEFGYAMNYDEDGGVYTGTFTLTGHNDRMYQGKPNAVIAFSLNGEDWESFDRTRIAPNDSKNWIGHPCADDIFPAYYARGDYWLSPTTYDVMLDNISKTVVFKPVSGSIDMTISDSQATDGAVYSLRGIKIGTGGQLPESAEGVYIVVSGGKARKMVANRNR